jgi:hypothetical protein
LISRIGLQQWEAAAEVGDRALELLEQHPQEVDLGISVRGNFSVALLRVGRQAEAVELLECASAAVLSSEGPRNPRLYDLNHNLAEVYISMQEVERAQGALETMHFVAQEAFGNDSWQAQFSLSRMGVLWVLDGRPQEGAELLRESYEAMRSSNSDAARQRAMQTEASIRTVARWAGDTEQHETRKILDALLLEWGSETP